MVKKGPPKGKRKPKGFDASDDPGTKVYTKAVAAATRGFNQVYRQMIERWGDSFWQYVPAEWSLAYDKLLDELHTAMEADDAATAAKVSERMANALRAMNKRAQDAGGDPLPEWVRCCEHGGQIYAFCGEGDIRQLRAEHPTWIIHSLQEAAVMFEKFYEDTFVAAVVDQFPAAKVKQAKTYDDPIEL
jgi:hypothetical protein